MFKLQTLEPELWVRRDAHDGRQDLSGVLAVPGVVPHTDEDDVGLVVPGKLMPFSQVDSVYFWRFQTSILSISAKVSSIPDTVRRRHHEPVRDQGAPAVSEEFSVDRVIDMIQDSDIKERPVGKILRQSHYLPSRFLMLTVHGDSP